MEDPEFQENTSVPAFNIPGIVLSLVGLQVLIHAVRIYFLSPQSDLWVISVFSFIPITYQLTDVQVIEPMARLWSPVTHALLHADWTHVGINMLWFIAFGSAVARRFGVLRFLLFSIAGALAGAAVFYAFQPDVLVSVVGFSGVNSAFMGAAVRFMFQADSRFSTATHSLPAISIRQSLSQRGSLSFIVIWLVLNYALGSGVLPMGVDGPIAWESHLGGFLLGWLAFSLFDKRPVQG